jgi:hypothetical protein
MDMEIMDLQVNNNCEKATANINVKVSRHMPGYQICLDDALPDSIKKDNDVMMSCPDRICAECGNDHSFRGNFADASVRQHGNLRRCLKC